MTEKSLNYIVAAIFFLFIVACVFVEAKADSGAIAGSSSQSGASAGSGAIAITNIGGGASTTTTDPRTGLTTTSTDGATTPFAAGGSSESGGGIGVGIGGSSSANNAGNEQSITFNSTTAKQHKNVPGVVAPSMTVLSNADSCLKSISGGGSGVGFGVSLGAYKLDKDCSRRVNASKIFNMGYRSASLQIMCGLPDVWASFEISGNSPCLNDKPDDASDIQTSQREPEVVPKAKPGRSVKVMPTGNSVLWSYPETVDHDFIY